ncbi:uncharacterized protein LOC105420525 [Amborella trichopoda]|uniref:uncharacterized protein LOC105420525 n=1 Tax=Amborella trichopoda TaxID=13333 RepID=UPI0005D2DACC|nr:uncharacterized protein LOC105420525 [Amborella trichopoda]|eukprot:XP_011622806.1 uncharacterized protein LOC105420525 [Amborella trichopoda]
MMIGFNKCVDVLVLNLDIQDIIYADELINYKYSLKSFGSPMAMRQRTKIDPANWWSQHGCSSPNLQKLAIWILNLTTSSSSCERNWSTFEGIYTKKRNRLESNRLNELVYVKYNQFLKDMFAKRDERDLSDKKVWTMLWRNMKDIHGTCS